MVIREDDVTLTSLTTNLSEPWKIHFVRVCEIDKGRRSKSLVALSNFMFLAMGRKVDGAVPLNRAPVNTKIIKGTVPKLPAFNFFCQFFF